MLHKKLTGIGKSKGLILDKTLLGLLGIDDAEEVSLKVEGRRLIVEPVYADPIEEIRARLRDDQDPEAADRLVNSAARKVRTETIRRLRADRGR